MLAGFGFLDELKPAFVFLQIQLEFSKNFFDKKC